MFVVLCVCVWKWQHFVVINYSSTAKSIFIIRYTLFSWIFLKHEPSTICSNQPHHITCYDIMILLHCRSKHTRAALSPQSFTVILDFGRVFRTPAHQKPKSMPHERFYYFINKLACMLVCSYARMLVCLCACGSTHIRTHTHVQTLAAKKKTDSLVAIRWNWYKENQYMPYTSNRFRVCDVHVARRIAKIQKNKTCQQCWKSNINICW